MSTRGLASDIARQLSRRGAIPETDYSMNPHKSLGENTPVQWVRPSPSQFRAPQTGARLDFGVSRNDMTTQFRPNPYWQAAKADIGKSMKGLSKAGANYAQDYAGILAARKTAAVSQGRMDMIDLATGGTTASTNRGRKVRSSADEHRRVREQRMLDQELASVGITNIRPTPTGTTPIASIPVGNIPVAGPVSPVRRPQTLDEFRRMRAQENADRAAATPPPAAPDPQIEIDRQARQQRARDIIDQNRQSVSPPVRTPPSGMTLDEFKRRRAKENAERARPSLADITGTSKETPVSRKKRKGARPGDESLPGFE